MLKSAAMTVSASALAGWRGPSDAPKTGPATIDAAKVPVGGGTVITPTYFVVTQPISGDFKGFSRVWAHAGCLGSTVAARTIDCACPCHGSEFSITDGAVVRGPATAALPAAHVSVSGATVTVSG